MNTLLIKNGRLFDPASKLDERADILVKEGIISAIGSFEPEPGWQTVDASGCIVTPGLIDMHAHLYPFLPQEYRLSLPALPPVLPQRWMRAAPVAAHIPITGLFCSIQS